MFFNKLIVFLILRKFHLKDRQAFQFTNQKSDAIYFFDGICLMKMEFGMCFKSGVSLNWFLNDECKIIKQERYILTEI